MPDYSTAVEPYIPIGSCFLAALVYIGCIVYAIVSETYIGGIDFPYFSDIGRDTPAYFLFSIGLTVASFGLVLTFIALSKVLRTNIRRCGPGRMGPVVVQLSRLGPWIGGFSCPFVALLAIFDTAKFPDIHLLSAYLFFGLSVIAISMISFVFKQISQALRDDPSITSSYQLKRGAAISFLLCFFVYIPVGLVVACKPQTLTLEDCLGKEDLGESFCEDVQDEDDLASTLVWDYSNCPEVNMMRSVAQFGCILSLLLFFGSTTRDLLALLAHQAGGINK